MIDRNLLDSATNREGLADVLRALGWPVDPEYAFEVEPEIAQGVKGAARVRVHSLVQAGAEDERLIILAEFQQPYVRRDLRELLRSLRQHIRETARFSNYSGLEDTIFIVASPDYEDVRFVLFEEQARRLPRIRSFGWRHEFIGRTVLTHNLERLRWPDRNGWEHAWDVEALTEQFYRDYEQVFASVLAQVNGANNEKQAHAWTQLLFNRLLFIAFVQRMGWLRVPGGSRDGYLFDLYRAGRGPFKSFLGMLRAAFDELDTPDTDQFKNRFNFVIGEVPYLNGGLFDQDDPLNLPDITVADAAFAAVLGEPNGLFAKYNFTVTESTPLDQEVAVDPEMLGKIFERLIIAEERHKTGTYYTPRPIVEFMVNEALKGYLSERGLAPEKAALLVDQDRVETGNLAFRPGELQDTLEWLFEVRAVDPACGSGAYLLMLLQRLFELVDRLEVSRDKRRNVNQKHLYETKLRLLQRCVYGVDLSETAVRIARLRLWLSLVVENRGEKPEPLPNFDFLIMQGDALASPLFPTQGVLGYPEADVREYTRMKRRYFHPEPGERRPAREEMQKQRAKIATALDDELSQSPLRKLSPKPFDWEVEFAEVFDAHAFEKAPVGREPGFDIVLANPPYVDFGALLESMGEPYKTALLKQYPRTAAGRADLYVYFFDRALGLLRAGGRLAFITSNKWLKAGYGKKLRSLLGSEALPHLLLDYNDNPVFQGVRAYPLITLSGKQEFPPSSRWIDVPFRKGDLPGPRVLSEEFGVELTSSQLTGAHWSLASEPQAQRPTAKIVPLRTYIRTSATIGIYTGLNDIWIDATGKHYRTKKAALLANARTPIRRTGVFVIDETTASSIRTADAKSRPFIKAVHTGSDFRKWAAPIPKERLLFVTSKDSEEDFPGIIEHLKPFKTLLGGRVSSVPWFALKQPQLNYAKWYPGDKIVFPDISRHPKFALDSTGSFLINSCYALNSSDLYLLGVLNSAAFEGEFTKISPRIRGGYLRFVTKNLDRAPVPVPPDPERAAIEALVQRILDLKREVTDKRSADVLESSPDRTDVISVPSLYSDRDIADQISDLEAEIDKRVEFLYFHADEAPTYDEWIARREAERGTAAEEVRNLIAGDESSRLEFKETLEYADRVDPNKPANLRNQELEKLRGERKWSVIKTICAFYNTKGGTLLIGVNDRKQVIGLEPDFSMLQDKKNRDGFENKLTNLLKSRISPIPTDVDIDFPELDGKLICRVVVPQSLTPHYADNRLFVRLGNSTAELSGRHLEDWLDNRRSR